MTRSTGQPAKIHITTSEMRQAIQRRWKAPEYAILWEVGDATGGRHSRWADAIIMGLWPSRGIDLQGVEIKIYRSDWQRELRNPSKAEQISRYCDFWWIHATPGVVHPEELPKGWGLRIYDGKTWKTVVEAERKTPEGVTREFLAALLRRSDQQTAKEAKRIADGLLVEERAKIEQEIQKGIEKKTKLSASLASVAEEFEKATGFSLEELSRYGTANTAARMTAALMKQDMHNPWGGLPYFLKQLRQMVDATSDAMIDLGLDLPTEEECMRPKKIAAARKR